MKRTCLYTCHQELKAKLVEFYGWMLPIQYSSMIEEHLSVRSASGMFDVSHMCPVDITGKEAKKFVQLLITTDINKLDDNHQSHPGLYSCLLNEQAGIIDDLIIFQINKAHYRMISNAGTRETIISILNEKSAQCDGAINFLEGYGMIAIQGPEARNAISRFYNTELSKALSPFYSCFIGEDFISRTGYTGEDGFEIIATENRIIELWKFFEVSGIRPCGLGSRDSLRMESGLNLYGSDMDLNINPYECGLNWVVDIEKGDFIGRDALKCALKKPLNIKRYGIILDEPGVLRRGYEVMSGGKRGILTSGGYSPSLKKSIGFLRIEKMNRPEATVQIRDKWLNASLTTLPFIKKGENQFHLIGENT
jgi:aminomethyltransferase